MVCICACIAINATLYFMSIVLASCIYFSLYFQILICFNHPRAILFISLPFVKEIPEFIPFIIIR